MAISDIVVIVIFVATVIICTVKGLAMTLYSTFSSIISIVGAFLLRPFVAAGFTSMGIDSFFYESIYTSISNVKTEYFGDATIGSGNQLAEQLNIPDFARKFLSGNVTNWDTAGSFDTIVEEMSSSLASLLVSVLSVILLIIIIIFAMFLLRNILSVFSKIPVIKQINKLGGFLIGIILAFFWISVAGLVAHLLSTAGFFTVVAADIDKSVVARYFYDTNFIVLLLSKL